MTGLWPTSYRAFSNVDSWSISAVAPLQSRDAVKGSIPAGLKAVFRQRFDLSASGRSSLPDTTDLERLGFTVFGVGKLNRAYDWKGEVYKNLTPFSKSKYAGMKASKQCAGVTFIAEYFKLSDQTCLN